MFELVYYLDDAMALAGPLWAWVGPGGPGWAWVGLGGPGWALVGPVGPGWAWLII